MAKKGGFYGLILCGGNNSRMGVQKCLLNYHGVPQWQYIKRLMDPFCDDIYMSVNSQQVNLFGENNKLIIDDDEFEGCGPMTALLSAFRQQPDATFLVIGCDYPFFNYRDIELLVANSGKNKTIACYNKYELIYEPLLAVYTPESGELLSEQFSCKSHSLRLFLEETRAEKADLPFTSYQSADTPERFLAAKVLIDDDRAALEQLTTIAL